MKAKTKALVFNFISFAFIFLFIRFLLGYFLEVKTIFLAIGSAITTMVLSPKFGAVEAKVYMKWIFTKGTREI